jgi:hypothetical protein
MGSSTLFGSVSNLFESSKDICFTIAIINKDHGSEWIRTSIALLFSLWHLVRGGADKYLDQRASPCRRMESLVSLERGVYSCADLQVFSYYRG